MRNGQYVHDKLQTEKKALKDYLIAKFDNEDWHGVQDAASDLRDIDSQLEILTDFGLIGLDKVQQVK